MTRPILVFGAGGRVGSAIAALSSDLYRTERDEWDITDAAAIREGIETVQPAAIINLAACTLPRAEQPEFRDEAEAVNWRAVEAMANLPQIFERVPIVQISTDCVFSGERAEPYTPTMATAPANWYGYTKLGGERALSDTPHIILRTTGVYLRGKPNFLETVLSKARASETLECVSDSIYSPTDARELARAILTATERVIEDPSVSGTYHFAGPDVMSYLDFARMVQEEAGIEGEIVPVTMADREKVEGFKRPRNASLNSDKFASVFDLRHRPTRECVRELVQPGTWVHVKNTTSQSFD